MPWEGAKILQSLPLDSDVEAFDTFEVEGPAVTGCGTGRSGAAGGVVDEEGFNDFVAADTDPFDALEAGDDTLAGLGNSRQREVPSLTARSSLPLRRQIRRQLGPQVRKASARPQRLQCGRGRGG